MKRRTTLNRIICAILTAILIVELFACIGITLVKKTLCSKEYIENELEKVNYYQTTKNEIEESFKYYVLQSNLDDSCVENLITVEKVKADTLIELNKYFENSKDEIEVNPIKQELSNRINTKVEKEYNNIITEQDKKNISKLVDIIVDNYTDNMKTIGSGFEIIHSISKKLDKIENTHIIIMYAITLATIILISVVYIFGTKNKKIILNKYHSIAFMTVGLMIIITIIALSITINEEEIQIFTKGITSVITDAIKSIKSLILMFGITSFGIGLGISIAKNVILRKYLR